MESDEVDNSAVTTLEKAVYDVDTIVKHHRIVEGRPLKRHHDDTEDDTQSMASNVADLFDDDYENGEAADEDNNDQFNFKEHYHSTGVAQIPLKTGKHDKPRTYSQVMSLASNYVNESSSTMLQVFQAFYLYLYHLTNITSVGSSFVIKRNSESLIAPLVANAFGEQKKTSRELSVVQAIRNVLNGTRSDNPIITDVSLSTSYKRLLNVKFENTTNFGRSNGRNNTPKTYETKRTIFTPKIDLIKMMKIETAPQRDKGSVVTDMFSTMPALANKRLVKPDLIQSSEVDDFLEYFSSAVLETFKYVRAQRVGAFYNLSPRCKIFKIVIEESSELKEDTKRRVPVEINEKDFWSRVGSKKNVRGGVTTKFVALTNEEIDELDGQHVICAISYFGLKVPTEAAISEEGEECLEDSVLYTTLSLRVNACFIVSDELTSILSSIDQDIVMSDDEVETSESLQI